MLLNQINLIFNILMDTIQQIEKYKNHYVIILVFENIDKKRNIEKKICNLKNFKQKMFKIIK